MKFVFSQFLLFLVVLFSGLLSMSLFASIARAAQSGDLHSLIHARTASQLARRIDEEKSHARDHLVCEAELRTGKVPAGCFRFIARNSSLETTSESAQEAVENHSFDWLLQICRDRARMSTDRRDLDRVKNDAKLPASCRETARERAMDLRYADEAEHPAELFSRLTSPSVKSLSK